MWVENRIKFKEIRIYLKAWVSFLFETSLQKKERKKELMKERKKKYMMKLKRKTKNEVI